MVGGRPVMPNPEFEEIRPRTTSGSLVRKVTGTALQVARVAREWMHAAMQDRQERDHLDGGQI